MLDLDLPDASVLDLDHETEATRHAIQQLAVAHFWWLRRRPRLHARAGAYDPVWITGLRARCLATLANAQRRTGELRAAANSAAQAHYIAGHDAGTPAAVAEVRLLAGLVERDGSIHRCHRGQRVYREASALFLRSHDLYSHDDPDTADLRPLRRRQPSPLARRLSQIAQFIGPIDRLDG